jgi:hypothetical protein
MCGYGFWRVLSQPEIERQNSLVQSLGIRAVVAVIIGSVLLRIGWKMALVADMSGKDNPRKPMIRF